MLDGLVAVGVVAHSHDGHFGDLVYRESVIRVIVFGRHEEDSVKSGVELLFSAHKADETLNVVENAPGVVERIPLSEVPSPFERTEGTAELPVLLPSVHQAVFAVIEIAVIEGGLPEGGKFLFALSEGFAESVNAPVIVGVLESAGRVLADAHITGYVPQGIVPFVSEPSGGTDLRMDRMRPMDDGLPEFFSVIAPDSADEGVGHNRSGIVAHHTVTMSRRLPLRQESAFEVIVDESLLDLHRSLGIDEVHKREKTPESVPETGVGEEVSVFHFPGVWAVMDPLPRRGYFRKVPREKEGPV